MGQCIHLAQEHYIPLTSSVSVLDTFDIAVPNMHSFSHSFLQVPSERASDLLLSH